jgi:hypothetical protein
MLPIKIRSSSVEKPQLTKTKSNLSTSSSRTNFQPTNYNYQVKYELLAENLKPSSKLLAYPSPLKSPKSHVLGHIPAYLLRMRSESKTVEYDFKKKRAELENQGKLLEEMQVSWINF